YDELDDDLKEQVDQLNLAALFRDELEREGAGDIGLLRFALRRLGQLNDASVALEVSSQIEKLYPIFPELIRYVRSLDGLDSVAKNDIGESILSLLEGSVISKSEYFRMWALDLFTRDDSWDNEKRFVKLLAASPDHPSRRKLILALGRSGQRHWFQSRWRDLFDEAPWPRRALIAAASCLSEDARKSWYRAIKPRLDSLELAVANWAAANPFA